MIRAVVEVFYLLRRLSMMTPYCRFPTTEALVQSVLPFGFLSGFCSRLVLKGGCYSRSAPGGLLFEIGVGGLLCEIGERRGGMVLCEKERKSRKGGERLQHFGKRFTKKKF
jgi:hypothetical protein